MRSRIKKLSERRDDDKEGDYIEKDAYDDMLALSGKANHGDIFAWFLHDYYDAAPADVEKRVPIPYRLVTEGGLQKEAFFKEFGLSLSRIWSNVSDFPNLLKSMAQMFFEFVKRNMVKYKEIEVDWTGGSENADDITMVEIQDVLKGFVEDSVKILKENGLFEKKEDDIKGFLGKINVENVFEWYEKMKKRV